jgi:hypothetical protein
MPNTVNINRLIALLGRLPPRQFNMNTFGTALDNGVGLTQCGTVACICGWANFLRMTEDEGVFTRHITGFKLSNMVAARQWLGIEEVEALELFLGAQHAGTEDAIKALELLRLNGKFSWSELNLSNVQRADEDA